MLTTSALEPALQSVLGIPDVVAPAGRVLREFDRLGVSADAAALWIRSLAAAEHRLPSADLVWTGPELSGLHARDTRQVYDELIGSAKHSLWLSTFVFFDGPRAFERLARQLDGVPGLQVTILLNLQRKRGDTTTASDLTRRFAAHFWKVDWPGSQRPAVFFDPRSLDLDGPGGVLHAKAVVADDETVFITSANLTDAALDRNIELGLLLRDRALATSIAQHFRGLIDAGLLSALPSS